MRSSKSLTASATLLLLSAGAAALSACFAGPPGGDPAGPAASVPDASAGAQTQDTSRGGALTTAAERGQALVQSHGCAGCHQGSDPKEGTLAGRATPVGGSAFPPNLTPDKATGLGDWTEEQIVRAIREGKNDAMDDLCEVMPRYADLSYAQASDIVAYLRGLTPVHRQAPESHCAHPVADGGADDAQAGDAAADDAAADAGAEGGTVALPDSGATCPGFVAPGAAGPCHGCGTHACQPNGCRSGLYCEVRTAMCHPKPATCP